MIDTLDEFRKREIALGFVWSLLVAIGFTSCQRWKQRQVREKHN